MFLCLLLCYLFFWSAFDCVILLFLYVFLLLFVLLCYLLRLPTRSYCLFRPFCIATGNIWWHIMSHQIFRAIIDRLESQKPSTVLRSRTHSPIGHGPSAHYRHSEIINCNRMMQLISHFLSVTSLPYATLTFMAILRSRSNRCRFKISRSQQLRIHDGNIWCVIITQLIFGF